MSFLDNPRNAGTALWIVGALEIVLAIVAIALYFGNFDGLKDKYEAAGSGLIRVVVGSVASIIVGAIYFGLGQRIRGGEINDKWGVVTNYVLAVATATAVIAIFSIINTNYEFVDGNKPELFGVSTIITMVIGLIIAGIIFWAYKKMTDGQATTADKIIWVLLVICFFIGIIGGVLKLIVIPIGTILGICDIIIYGFMLVALFDPEVKQKMGM